MIVSEIDGFERKRLKCITMIKDIIRLGWILLRIVFRGGLDR